MTLASHLEHLNLPIHLPFAAPVLCVDLALAEMTKDTHFYWKIGAGSAFIWSRDFDPDAYYTNAETVIDSFTGTNIVPAYTSADLEKLIGTFSHICKNGEHEVFPHQYTRIGMRKAPRYADALALITLELLKRRIITPGFANTVLAYPTKNSTT